MNPLLCLKAEVLPNESKRRPPETRYYRVNFFSTKRLHLACSWLVMQ
jgi:hypothetical protein